MAAEIENVRSRQVSVIAARAGFGKTSVAAVWAELLRLQGRRVGWVSLDPEDDEPARFCLQFVQALHRASDQLALVAMDLLSDVSMISVDAIFVSLLNDVARDGNEFYLFLDDFHWIRNGEINYQISSFLKHAPENFHLVVIGRTEPALPLADLRVKNRLFELDGGSLGFDTEEIAAFLERERLGALTPNELYALREKTEGWPAILRILAITSAQVGGGLLHHVQQISGRLRPVSQYLKALMAGLPADVVNFMLDISILDRFCADLCDVVARARVGAGILGMLDQKHLLLVPLDLEGRWFRFHPLLVDHLREMLKAQRPHAVADLHRRAAEWCAETGYWTEAIKHALAAGETELATGWIKTCAMSLVRSGDLLTLLSWRHLFPAVMDRQIKAKLAIAWGWALGARFEDALALAAEVEASLDFGRSERALTLQCECDTIRAVIHAIKGNLEEALALVQRPLATFTETWAANTASNVAATCYWRAGDLPSLYRTPWIPLSAEEAGRNIFVLNYRLCLLGLVEFEQLRFGQAERRYLEAQEQTALHASPQSAPAAVCASLLARLRYEQGRLEEAEALLSGRLPLIGETVMLDCAVSAYLVLVRTAALRGDVQGAHSILNQGEAVGYARRWGPLLAALLVERLRLFAIEKRMLELDACNDRLQRMAAEAPLPVPSPWSNIPLYGKIGMAVTALAHGQAQQAADLLYPAYRELKPRYNQHLVLRISVQLAIALFECGNLSEADGMFLSAMKLAAGGGALRCILDEGVRVEPLLLRFLKAGRPRAACAAEAAFGDALLESLRRGDLAGTDAPRAREAAPSLTARERKVLEMMSRGWTNKEIARDLNVAAETVKSHVKHIFTKLEVDRRAQAVMRGRELGLLAER